MTIKGALRSTVSESYSLFGFLDLVNSANLTFKGSEVEIDGLITDSSELRFNSILNLSEYGAILGNSYSAAIVDLNEILHSQVNKFDILYFITGLIADIESLKMLLQKETDGQYQHKLFKFINISKEVKFQSHILYESDCQEPYYWIDHYISKMSIFLLNLRESLEKTQLDDFFISKPNQVDANSSNVNAPIEFFEYLFARGGLHRLHQDFIPSPEDRDNNDLLYDSNNETITHYYQDSLTGEWMESSRSFKEIYTNKLYNEHLVSKKLIDAHIDNLSDENTSTHFIKLTLNRLKYLLSEIERNNLAKKYVDSTRPISALIRFISNKYKYLVPEEFLSALPGRITINGTPFLNSQQGSPPIATIKTFEWKCRDAYRLSLLLWQQLKENSKFIDESTSLETFHNAFNGSSQEKPLNIRWTLKGRNQQVNKLQIFYLLNKLAEAYFIEIPVEHSILFDRVGFIFCDAEGSQLNHLDVSYSDSLKHANDNNADQRVIDDIVKVLSSTSQTDKVSI